jgi:hypothetical protein
LCDAVSLGTLGLQYLFHVLRELPLEAKALQDDMIKGIRLTAAALTKAQEERLKMSLAIPPQTLKRWSDEHEYPRTVVRALQAPMFFPPGPGDATFPGGPTQLGPSIARQPTGLPPAGSYPPAGPYPPASFYPPTSPFGFYYPPLGPTWPPPPPTGPVEQQPLTPTGAPSGTITAGGAVDAPRDSEPAAVARLAASSEPSSSQSGGRPGPSKPPRK